ncbi:MAG: cyclic pyranopterin monophosphate synthase MoaC [Candidatus Delongbacteria bacterium]|nr:cyclic pyranopterin monophosphate synthase MoaC [Candidatus Delongbacteria bacterium]
MSDKFSHVDENGKANMVDVGQKPDVIRTASAEGKIYLNSTAMDLIKVNKNKKGDVLTTAQIAGIQGGKRTSDLIPLCHPLMITKLDVNTELMSDHIKVTSFAKCIGKTGIEMEALTAVNIALLTIYDMCKAVDKTMVISDVKLISKTKENLT